LATASTTAAAYVSVYLENASEDGDEVPKYAFVKAADGVVEAAAVTAADAATTILTSVVYSVVCTVPELTVDVLTITL